MTAVNTVLGPLDTGKLGFTLMHEHLLMSPAAMPQNYPELLGVGYKGRILNELVQARKGGVNTIVEGTTFDIGRDVALMAEMSRRSGINIIACAGSWLDEGLALNGVPADALAEVFIREIEVGITGTNIKAGILKGASDVAGVTPLEATILRGLARAHLRTGVPIMLHSNAAGQVARQQVAVLKEEGVDLGRVKVDHSNDTSDLEYLTWLLEQGCYLGLDRYPGFNLSPQARTRTLKALLDAGYGDRLLLSHDRIIVCHTADTPRTRKMADVYERNPHGFLYLQKVVFVQLREMGVSEATLTALFVDNPRRFFEGS